MAPGARAFRRRSLLIAALGTLVAATLSTGRAQADCALIPAAIRQLPSVDGSIDRPFAAPGNTVTIFSDGACKPGADQPHFDPDPLNNEITIIFQPPTLTVPPAVTPFAASAVLNCGVDRCFALEFQIPDTTGLAGAFPLTGPARIEVRNSAAGGVLVAVIDQLFEPVKGCNNQNRTLNLFVNFTVLPPKNPYTAAASASINATLDGSGSLLIPLDYATVLPTAIGGSGTVRLLTIQADIPNGLLAGNGLAGADGTFIRPPRFGRFVRAFSLNGRPIPPLLEIAASLPLSVGGVEYGDTILGSVDFIDSVLRIARIAEDPGNPGSPLQIFALAGEQGPAGLSLQAGVGPVVITGVNLAAGAAAPLNSVSSSANLAVVARDEALEAQFGSGQQNGDGDSEDRVIHFVDLSSNTSVTTGLAVQEAGDPTPRAIVDSAGTSVGFFQSEIHTDRSDLNGDNDSQDGIVRIWNADGSHAFCGGSPCNITNGTVVGNPALPIFNEGGVPRPLVFSGVADPGRYLFFGRSEGGEGTVITDRLSVGPGNAQLNGSSFNATASPDGQYVAFSSNADNVASGEASPFTQVYFRDTFTGANTLASATAFGGNTPANGSSDNVMVGNGGLQATFDSAATNLVVGDTEGFRDVFAYEGTILFENLRLSAVNPLSGTTGGNGDSWNPRFNGTAAAFQTNATNLAATDTNGATDIIHVSSMAVLTRASLTSTGGEPNDSCENASVGGLSNNLVAFECAASNMVPSDTNAVKDVFVRDIVAGTTLRVSVGSGGTEANAASFDAMISPNGRFVVFSSAATNLLAPGTTLNAPIQCYVYDILKETTELVSRTLGGEGGDVDCTNPFISPSARFITFASAATNFQTRLGTNRIVWRYDRLLDTIAAASRDAAGNVVTAGPTGTRSSMGELLQEIVTWDTAAADLGVTDTNSVSDAYATRIAGGPSFNSSGPFADSDAQDTVLHVFDTVTRSFINTQLPIFPFGQVYVAAGRAAIVAAPFNGSVRGVIWDQEAGGVLREIAGGSFDVASVALSRTTFCAVNSATGQLYVGEPSTGNGAFATGTFTSERPEIAGDLCVVANSVGQLVIVERTGPATLVVTNTGVRVTDFQVADAGVAFRTCEADAGLDLNGDGDLVDCVMNFWDFATSSLTETGQVAIQCTFTGCDPFFEPYRVGPGFVSFVTDERLEVNAGGTGQVGTSCLPTSPAGVCDKTGDEDGDDVAVEIFSLASGRAQVFPLKRETPPVVPPFPTVTPGATDTNVMVIQLPAEVLGSDFATLPPAQLVTVIVGDPEGDSVFESDGNTDPLTAVVDKCQEVSDPAQVDLDGDGMGASCDTTLVAGAPNDNPGTAPEPAQLPGEDLCDLDRSGIITRTEVNQIWSDRGTPITAAVVDLRAPLDGNPDATDDRDRDADGEISAVDFRLCLGDCDAQAGGCPLTEGGPPDFGFRCGLLGIEALLALIPWVWRRRYLGGRKSLGRR